MSEARVICGDCREILPTLEAGSVQTVITSPPYFQLRSYDGGAAEIGTETAPAAYIANLVAIFREVRRVLRDDGTLWLNLGDFMLPDKCEAMIPHRVVIALIEDGWICRSTIIWHKLNALPESAKDRPTKAHEYLFLLSRSPHYYYDADAIREPATGHQQGTKGVGDWNKLPYELRPERRIRHGKTGSTLHSLPESGRNKRSVWSINTTPYPDAHFATFPPGLIEPCVLAGAPVGGLILDPFAGSGTALWVAQKNRRRGLGIELNSDYVALAEKRITGVQVTLPLDGESA